MNRLYTAAYYASILFVMGYVTVRFDFIFNNFAVQLFCVCGGMALLYWLLQIERG